MSIAQNRYAVNLESGCWDWCGEIMNSGYGRLWADGARHLAHRYFFEQNAGPIPAGHEIDHTCSNKRCVNPKHLDAVTTTENRRRAGVIKGLSPDQIEEMKRLRASGMQLKDIAGRYGVTEQNVHYHVSGKPVVSNWRVGAKSAKRSER